MTDLTCGFCGTKHTNPADYAKCVAKCAAKDQEEKKRAEQARIEAERQAEKSRKEAAHQARLDRIKKIETELEKLYQEEMDEYPQTRNAYISKDLDILEKLFPGFFR